MRARNSLFHPVFAIMVAAGCAALTAHADTTITPNISTVQPPAQPTGPSVNNDAFTRLRTQCETEVPSGKASGDICVDAANMLVGSDIPDVYRDMGEDQRIKIALRLLERGVDSSNLARGRAYDWYNKTSFSILGLSPYADSFRAAELMDMMTKSNYPGGTLRKIRTSTSILSFGAFGSSEDEKRQGCATAKRMLGEGKLDADSASIAKDVAGSNICTGYEPIAK